VNRLVKTDSEGQLEPYHDQLRQVVLQSLQSEHGLHVHQRLAKTIGATQIASERPDILVHHLEGAGLSSEAAIHAKQAALRFADVLAFHQAAELFRLALRLGEWSAQEREELQLQLAEVLVSGGHGAEAAPIFLEASSCEDVDLSLQCRTRAAEQFLVTGHFRKGTEVLEALLADLGVSVPKSGFGTHSSLLLGRARLQLRKQRDLSKVGQDTRADSKVTLRLNALQAAANGMMIVDPVRASLFQTRHLLLALRAGDAHQLVTSLAMEAQSLAFMHTRHIPRAKERLQAATQIQVRQDDPELHAIVTMADGMIRFHEHRYVQAAKTLAYAERLFLKLPHVAAWQLNHVRMHRLIALLNSGQFGQMRERVERYASEAQQRNDRYTHETVVRVGSLAWLVADEPAQAERLLANSLWHQGQFQLSHWLSLWAHVELALYEDEADSALRALRPSFEAVKKSSLFRLQSLRVQTLTTQQRTRHPRQNRSRALACSTGSSRRRYFVCNASSAECRATGRYGPGSVWHHGAAPAWTGDV
jgi:hypothetical protein